MIRLTANEVHAQKIAELGLDPAALDLTSIEGSAGAVRRAASLLCPCSAATLVRGVVRPLRGLVPDLEAAKGVVEETLDAMIAHGDLLEQRELENEHGTARMLLYAAPASFVVRASGMVVLLGIASDQLSPLPDELAGRIEYAGHVRRLHPGPGEDPRNQLKELGLLELSYDGWVKPPAPQPPANVHASCDAALDRAEPSREIPGLAILDPERPVRYYPGRWIEPRAHSGRFVARRRQAYGADLWCYVQLHGGHPERMIDFPQRGSRWRGFDEAWRLQMAIDSGRGRPQCFRIRAGPAESAILELFSPVPAWARRRWDAIGEPVASSGCLFAYRLALKEIEEERRFLQGTLWLEEL